MKTREKWKFFREVVLATRALSVSEQVKNVLTTIVKLIGRKFTLVVLVNYLVIRYQPLRRLKIDTAISILFRTESGDDFAEQLLQIRAVYAVKSKIKRFKTATLLPDVKRTALL
jgi:hypothetical protein